MKRARRGHERLSKQTIRQATAWSASSAWSISDAQFASGAVIQFSVGSGGALVGATVRVGMGGAGYKADRNDPVPGAIVHTMIVGRPPQTYTIQTDDMLGLENLTFQDCWFQFGSNALRLRNARHLRVLDSRFDDQGPDGRPIDLIDTSQALVRGNRIHRPVGVANDGECGQREVRLQSVMQAA